MVVSQTRVPKAAKIFWIAFIVIFTIIKIFHNSYYTEQVKSKTDALIDARRKQVAKVCHIDTLYGDAYWPWKGGSSWYNFKELGVSWCPIYGEAVSETLRLFFCAKLGYAGRCSDTSLERYFYPSSGLDDGAQPSFMITRHPLMRIANFYAKKFLRGAGENRVWSIKTIGAIAILDSRNALSKMTLEGSDDEIKYYAAATQDLWKLKAKEFFESIVDEKSLLLADEDNPFLNPIIPTFDEYIRFVCKDISLAQKDPLHEVQLQWKPMAESCPLCQRNYAFFVKFEAWEGEVIPFFRELGLSPPAPSNGTELDTLVNPYLLSFYNRIDASLIAKLEKYYELDYSIFGYGKYPDVFP